MAIDSYSNLVQAIIDTAEDDSAEFQAYIPIAIDLAEERLLKELDFPELETTSVGQVTSGNPFLNKPTVRNHVLKNLFIFKTTGERVEIEKRLLSYCYDYWPNPTITGFPKYYCNSTDSQYQIVPTPSEAFNFEYRYQYYPPKLSPTQTSNYFLTNGCKEALFQACMVNMSRFMKHWTVIPVFEQAYQQAAMDWNSHAARQRRDESVAPQNIEGAPSTLKHTSEGTNA